MKKLILFLIIGMMLISIASSQIELTPKDKLKNYADTNFKTELKYKNIKIDNYEIQDKIAITKLTIDGKQIRWITSKERFDKITNEK